MTYVIRTDATHGSYFCGIEQCGPRLLQTRIWWDARKWAKKFATAGAAKHAATRAGIRVGESREDAEKKGLSRWVEPYTKPRPA